MPPDLKSGSGGTDANGLLTIDEIDSIVTATAAAAAESQEFKRVDKSKEINEVIANWANNPSAYFSQLNGRGGQSGKSIIISNMHVGRDSSPKQVHPSLTAKLQLLTQNNEKYGKMVSYTNLDNLIERRQHP